MSEKIVNDNKQVRQYAVSLAGKIDMAENSGPIYMQNSNMWLMLEEISLVGNEWVMTPVMIEDKVYTTKQIGSMFAEAFLNMERILPPRLYAKSLLEVKDFINEGNVLGKKLSKEEYQDYMKFGEYGLRLTNIRWKGGAIAILYPGVLTMIAQLLHESYYVAIADCDVALIFPQSSTNLKRIYAYMNPYWKELSDKDKVCQRIMKYNTVSRKLELV